MDLRRLTYFVAVAEERHLGRAAERLHLSQPPLTRQIKALEAEVGAQLFERTPRGMVLTHAGETLLRDARAIFGMVDQAADRAHRAGRGRLGRLDVGVYGSAIFGIVPNILARFSRENSDVEIALYHAQTPQQVSALRQGRVLIVFERLLPADSDLQVERVASEPLWVAMSDNHPLARRKKIPVALLRNHALAVGSSPSATATLLRLCAEEGFEPQIATQTSDVVMATMLTAFSSCLTVVPYSMLSVQFPGVRYVPLVAARGDATMELYCFYRKDEASPLLQRMLETVRTYSTDLPLPV
jgi:DNA-binding transcriptional LysR family regulator